MKMNRRAKYVPPESVGFDDALAALPRDARKGRMSLEALVLRSGDKFRARLDAGTGWEGVAALAAKEIGISNVNTSSLKTYMSRHFPIYGKYNAKATERPMQMPISHPVISSKNLVSQDFLNKNTKINDHFIDNTLQKYTSERAGVVKKINPGPVE